MGKSGGEKPMVVEVVIGEPVRKEGVQVATAVTVTVTVVVVVVVVVIDLMKKNNLFYHQLCLSSYYFLIPCKTLNLSFFVVCDDPTKKRV